MPNLRAFFIRLLGCCSAWALLSVVSAGTLSAQQVEWRHDYNKARLEALEKARPLMIDFYTVPCVWCDRLDNETFRDPEIINLLNTRCVPVKLHNDANPTNAKVVRDLQIQSFPTLVFASADGRILGTQEGYLVASALKDKLLRVIAAVSDPEWMLRDYQEALRSKDNNDPARAIALLKTIVVDGKERPVQVKAGQLLKELEQQAALKLKQAQELAQQRGHATEAIAAATDLVQRYAGTLAARGGTEVLVHLANRMDVADNFRAQRARDLLAQAREDYQSKQLLCCLDRCELLVNSFADLPEAAEARQIAAEIKSNPEWTKQACDQLGDRLSVLYLGLADTFLKKGQPQQAIFYLERVIQTFPNTRHAEVAQVRLSLLQGRPAPGLDPKK
jgi:thioredoxin-related protein/outer membrane protein assembly factor BamD (BamD/ComL family)